MAETERKPLPPYLPYKTFGTFLEHLRAIGMPSHIDKSVMSNLSGGMQSWLKAALRYMKLITADDVPTAALETLVQAQGDERKALIASLFKSSYAFLDGKVDLERTTPTQLRSAIVEYGATGETVEKIVAFMLAMAKDADIKLATLLTTRAASPRRAKRPPTPRPNGGPQPGPDGEDDDEDENTGGGVAMKTVALPIAGGTVTLSGNINVFELVGKERELVFALIDLMRDFENASGGGAS